MKRTSALIIVAPMALAIIALLVLPLLVDKEKIVDLAAAMLREQTGATLVIGGDIGLRLFPGVGVSLEDVSLTMPEERQPAMRVRSLQLGLQLLPLLSREVAIERLELTGLEYQVAATAPEDKVDTGTLSDAQLDAYYAQRRRERGSATSTAGVLAIPLALNVATLKVDDSRLVLEDAGGNAPTIIELRRFQARDLNLQGRPVSLEAEVDIPGERLLRLDVAATLLADQGQQLLDIEDLELTASGAAAEPVKLAASGRAQLERQAVALQLEVELGATRGQGNVAYTALESPVITADMHFNRFDPAILALAGPDAAPATDSQGDGDGDTPLPLAGLRDIDTRATLVIDEAVLAGHKLRNVQLQLRALEGVIEVQPLRAELYGGQVVAQATFNGRHNTATLTTTGTVDDLDIAAALAGAARPALATGRASLKWDLQAAGRTRNQLVNALAGPISLQTSEVVLQDIAIQRLLCEAVALTNKETLSAQFPATTHFQALAADLRLGDGTAHLQPLRAELDHIGLTGTGSYTLLEGDFDATFKARLSPGLESLDRACRVSKRLTAIDWPLDCKGNIEGEPTQWCKVDTAQIVRDLSVNEAQRKIEKKAGKLLEKLFN